jgi:hypothetical protein
MRFTIYRPNEALRRFANPTTWGESVPQKRNPALTGKITIAFSKLNARKESAIFKKR